MTLYEIKQITWKLRYSTDAVTKNCYSFGNNFRSFVFQTLLLSLRTSNCIRTTQCQRFTSRGINNSINWKYRNSQLRPDATTVCLVDSLSENTYCTMKWQLIFYSCLQISHKDTSGQAIPWNQESSIKR